MICFYIRLWDRTNNIIFNNNAINYGADANGCLNTIFQKPPLKTNSFALEFLFLVLFQIFQFNFSLNAIFNQFTTQAIVITLINGVVALYGFIHVFEIRRIVTDISYSCAISIDPKYMVYDFPFILTSLVLAATMGYFAHKVRHDLAERIYKKIGLDVTMQVLFKIRLIFLMLMKLNMYFMIVIASTTVYLFVYITDENLSYIVFRTLIIIQFSVVIVQFAAQYIVHRAVPKESFPLMKLFNCFWFIILVDWFIFLIGSVILAINGGSWVLLFFTVPYCYIGIITFIYAWKTSDTFNQGLREYVGLRLNRNHELIIKIEDVEDYRPPSRKSSPVDNYKVNLIQKPDEALIF
ncbi:Golgi apparatus membrane protein [Gigaspora margarita]|nr:Golgi apparatus membrane protein [Gigaspora margarita]